MHNSLQVLYFAHGTRMNRFITIGCSLFACLAVVVRAETPHVPQDPAFHCFIETQYEVQPNGMTWLSEFWMQDDNARIETIQTGNKLAGVVTDFERKTLGNPKKGQKLIQIFMGATKFSWLEGSKLGTKNTLGATEERNPSLAISVLRERGKRTGFETVERVQCEVWKWDVPNLSKFTYWIAIEQPVVVKFVDDGRRGTAWRKITKTYKNIEIGGKIAEEKFLVPVDIEFVGSDGTKIMGAFARAGQTNAKPAPSPNANRTLHCKVEVIGGRLNKLKYELWMKGDKARMESEETRGKRVYINSGDAIYSYTDSKKTGLKQGEKHPLNPLTDLYLILGENPFDELDWMKNNGDKRAQWQRVEGVICDVFDYQYSGVRGTYDGKNPPVYSFLYWPRTIWIPQGYRSTPPANDAPTYQNRNNNVSPSLRHPDNFTMKVDIGGMQPTVYSAPSEGDWTKLEKRPHGIKLITGNDFVGIPPGELGKSVRWGDIGRDLTGRKPETGLQRQSQVTGSGAGGNQQQQKAEGNPPVAATVGESTSRPQIVVPSHLTKLYTNVELDVDISDKLFLLPADVTYYPTKEYIEWEMSLVRMSK